jgi:ABC-2 type transport system permease protein
MTNTLTTLIRREWLQHRVGWLLMALVPLGLALLALGSGVGSIQIDVETIEKTGPAFPIFLAMATTAGTLLIVFFIEWMGSLFIALGLARRDHADRSVEFWLSTPVSHTHSLGVPLVVHTVLVPMAALLVGLLGGYVVSAIVVTRMVGGAEWAALPWAQLLPASLAFVLRLAAGLVLATLWLAPLILLTVLMGAWFRKWGMVIVGVGLGLGGIILSQAFGLPQLKGWLETVFAQAGRAFLNLGAVEQGERRIKTAGDVVGALQDLPSWALADFGLALRELASPVFVLGLLMAAACFYGLVRWRQRGAMAGD